MINRLEVNGFEFATTICKWAAGEVSDYIVGQRVEEEIKQSIKG